MEINRDNIFYILKQIGLSPSKNNGQNFLIDAFVSEKIVSCLEINSNDKVLEIGPGLGSLTHFINKKTSLDAVDIDSKICDFISFTYKNENVNIFHQDALKYDVNKYTKIISNVPYSVTSELLEYLFLNANNCQKYVLMVQEEVFFRLTATNGKNYCPLGILGMLLGVINRKLTVKPSSFYPQPKCKSIVFTLDIKPKFDFELCKDIYKTVESLFLNRRKTILNNLLNITDKEVAMEILNKNNINPMYRPEQLKIDDFCNIFFSLKNR